jgi:lipopolysaccharide transport system permease protein
VHFPSVVVPVAAVGASLVELAPTSLVLAALAAYFDAPLAGTISILPFWVLGAALTAFGVALWLLPLRVTHDGTRNVIPSVSLIWLLASPVFWATPRLPESHPMLGLNPMFSIVHGFRSAVFGSPSPPPLTVVVSLAAIAMTVVTGWTYFRRDRLGDLLEFRIVRRGPRE